MNMSAMRRAGAGTVRRRHLGRTVDHLAEIIQGLLDGSEEFVCCLEFAEAEALADVLDAGHHPATAAHLMHRWALTEPEWGDDVEHSDSLHRWLALSVAPDRVAALA
ncbi:hypothetical protein [Microbacterium sp. BK668]|uniref:hypothetical protein n=1 Tax=Microbacterium sp. BK668 TaxID=2512118 RepID=UPI00105E28D8|nr:hypothetical protein [Microbacterium sp. BK668]TDN92635.1 hypothetical protein EV279_2161 [Microbacterium sp. BK668]